jgi:hypothetical protein
MKTNLQNKWRLPTKKEFEEVLHPNKDSIPNLKNYSVYWSSTEEDYGYASFAWFFSFGTGRAYYDHYNYKSYTSQVRAVRDVSNDSTNSSNSTIIGNLEIYNEDLGRMSWYEAIAAVDKLNYKNNINNIKNSEIWYMKREAAFEKVLNVVEEFKNKLSNDYQVRVVQSKSGGRQWSDTPSNSHYIYVYKKTDKLNSKYPAEPLMVIRVSDHLDNGNSGNYYDDEILVNRNNQKSVDDIINSISFSKKI